MSYYSKFNIVYRLQKWMDSVPGQTFLNYAYSWGASIVIAGTLFKLTHLPGANLMLFLGMGTEILVFFLSAFDRPFDKTAEGRDLPTHATEEYLEGKVSAEEMMTAKNRSETIQPQVASPVSPVMTAAPELTPLNPEVVEVQNSYVEQLKSLVETLSKVNEQSSRLTRDSEEMENLNRTLTGISRVYEMQLKSASQTKMMAKQIEQLNKIYTRMIDAMTINMRVAAPHVTSEE
ncbi:gliding motility protein GldL [Prevotella copri]|nr:gliding motility protein GldL [Segatella copri]